MTLSEAVVPDEEPVLPAGLRDEVLGRLGLPRAVSLDHDGLSTVYAAWCARVPFDNVRKVIALRTGRPLPGRTAEDFFEAWLEDGAGGTCWPSSNALYALVRSFGFAASRAAGSMRDTGPINHATIRVAIGADTWLIDSSMLTVAPVPLASTVFIGTDPVFAAESEPEAGTHLVWVDFPPNPDWFPCRLLPDPITREFHLARYEASREQSIFNSRLFARRNYVGEKRVLVGPSRVSKTASGMEMRELSRDELCAALREDIGISPALTEEWAACGGLDAAYEELPGPKPAPDSRKPPSQR
jgi:N-hydroxyarylamine O-acetyltransferase